MSAEGGAPAMNGLFGKDCHYGASEWAAKVHMHFELAVQ